MVQALQVLEVREQLERGPSGHEGCSGGLETLGATGQDLSMAAEDLDDGEKALVREMCNVSYQYKVLFFPMGDGKNTRVIGYIKTHYTFNSEFFFFSSAS